MVGSDNVILKMVGMWLDCLSGHDQFCPAFSNFDLTTCFII